MSLVTQEHPRKEIKTMMISPEGYYIEHLEGRSVDEIEGIIRRLKREIGRLKNIVEEPNYRCTMHPSESTRVWCMRLYLSRAREAILEAGGSYTPSKRELRAEKFNADIPFIKSIELSIGSVLRGFDRKIIMFDGEHIRMSIERSFSSDRMEMKIAEEEMDKSTLLCVLADLHIGEWRRRYKPERFGLMVCDGTEWQLCIRYTDARKTFKVEGSNSYPYNFEELCDLFDIEQIEKTEANEQK